MRRDSCVSSMVARSCRPGTGCPTGLMHDASTPSWASGRCSNASPADRPVLFSPTPRGELRGLSGAVDRQVPEESGDERPQRLPDEVVLHRAGVSAVRDHAPHPLDLDPLDRRVLGLERVRQPLDDHRDLDDLLTAGCPQDLPVEAVLEVGVLALAHDAGREPAHAREIAEVPLDAFAFPLIGSGCRVSWLCRAHNGTASRRAWSITGPWERPEAMSTCTPMTDSSSSVRSMTSSRSVPSGKVTMRSRSVSYTH